MGLARAICVFVRASVVIVVVLTLPVRARACLLQNGSSGHCVYRFGACGPYFDEQARSGVAFRTLDEIGVVRTFGVGVIMEYF